MSDNPQYGAGAAFALPHFRILRLSGPDATGFAQAQFMNDVAALADGGWQWSGWLNPKGRVQALFALVRQDATTLLLLGQFDAGALRQALLRYVFRSRLAIEAPGEWHASGAFAAPRHASGARAHVDGDGDIELDLTADGGARVLRVGPTVRGAVEPALERAWHAFDLAHGWPAVPGADLTPWTPQQLSLERLAAFSVRKGCYPGQEIVARTHFLGRPKRGLALLEIEGAAPGDRVLQDGADLGAVVAAAGACALAVLPADRAGNAELRVGSATGRECSLKGGLAR